MLPGPVFRNSSTSSLDIFQGKRFFSCVLQAMSCLGWCGWAGPLSECRTLRRFVFVLVNLACLPQMCLIEGWMTYDLFLKRYVQSPEGWEYALLKAVKKSLFVWDMGGSYRVKSHIPNVLILPCHTSGGQAFWQKWYSKKPYKYSLQCLLTLCSSHWAVWSFCVPAAWYRFESHLSDRGICLEKHSVIAAQVMHWGLGRRWRCRVVWRQEKWEILWWFYVWFFLNKNFITYFTKEIISSQ